MLRHLIAQTRVNFTPDFNAIPGAGPVQQLINGIGAFALLLSLVGIIIGGAMWGVGSLSSNYHQAAVGKRATLYSVVGAVIVGAAATQLSGAEAPTQVIIDRDVREPVEWDINHIHSAFQWISDVFDVMDKDSAEGWKDVEARLSQVPFMLEGYREVAPLPEDETAEARILWRHLQIALYLLGRLPQPGLSWAERPAAMPICVFSTLIITGRLKPRHSKARARTRHSCAGSCKAR